MISTSDLRKFGSADIWGWDSNKKSHEAVLSGHSFRRVLFHPDWSNGTAGVLATKPLNGTKCYWEIKISDRIFGTSMMVGIGTEKSRTHADSFVNLIGEDDHSWGLSHKGLLWHNNESKLFCEPLKQNEGVTFGLFFDGVKGTLSVYKNSQFLGIAFDKLHLVKENIYPMVSSTAAKTEMKVVNSRREFYDLQDRCRTVLLTTCENNQYNIDLLPIPYVLKNYLRKNTLLNDD